MREFPCVCTSCDFTAPGPGELGAHIAERHEPQAREDLVEMLDRGASPELDLLEAEIRIGAVPIPECSELSGAGARLDRLRTAAAEAIASRRRPRLVELNAELHALHALAAEERDRQARIAALALSSAETIASVLEVLSEAPA